MRPHWVGCATSDLTACPGLPSESNFRFRCYRTPNSAAYNVATFADFEADLIRVRTREGMAIARAKGKLRGKSPKLSDKQQQELRRMHNTGDYSISDLAHVFFVLRPTVYRTLKRQLPTKQ